MRSGKAAILGALLLVWFSTSARAEEAAPAPATVSATAPAASAIGPAAAAASPVAAPASPATAAVPPGVPSSADAPDVAPPRAHQAEPEQPLAPAEAAVLRREVRRNAAALDALEERLAAERSLDAVRVRVSGYAQIDWIVHNQASQNQIDFSSNLPLNQDRFTLRRGHVRVDAERRWLLGSLELDANTTSGPQVRPIDAEVSVRWPEKPDPALPSLLVTAGLMKIPFGFEVPELDYVRPFLERSTMMRAFFPGEFDLGARLRVQYRMFDLALAVMNGNPIGSRAFPALAPDSRKDIVGRLGVDFEIVHGVALQAGVSAETGRGLHVGTPTTKDQVIWRDDNGDGLVQATEVQVIPGSSATASQDFPRFAIGADARLSFRFADGATFALRAELVRAQNLDRGIVPADPTGAGYDLRELGWYVGATQELTRWALVGVRYDRYDPDQDAHEQQAIKIVPADRSFSTLALLAMLRYESARLSLEYDKNWNALGRDQSGAPATLKSDAVTVRAQVVF